ncbi:hypothetical protein FNF27_02241 [Cafeteria roenbergensis]|uniref:HpcH/HpaI aldolase/citrate lyase domain-containing protein n=1 Tax=Cafeteria roenbergensis TaxID=33653 RepID=A0A5A8DRG4_CAFRO|nr:hypothetical protein FNF29_02389 [Cafeteria roenbergensis]KAA0158205.1 hypothetical protein FNF28_06362 [Cafeteria roenbergensis]KAA0168022.1 hypothetical protein FNF31_00521 [Cafeteria roenbergensis]KAA0176184.1 hypothetical protein FNF27_02241 [Cafeteria roenbergensis]|eukprot:KAA0154512.1 hypothetical protein FNF29_02389 [Cafeteria roenbergensis]
MLRAAHAAKDAGLQSMRSPAGGKLLRSVLFSPGASEKRMAKAASLACDGVILDLEDSVAPDAKVQAREAVGRILASQDFGDKTVVVRVNALNTEWGRRDVAAVVEWGRVDAIAVPKVECAEDVHDIERSMRRAGGGSSSLPIWAFVETAKGIIGAPQIAECEQVTALAVGCNDLTRDLGARFTPDRAPLLYSLSAAVVAARAGGVVCLDGVPAKVWPSEEELAAECAQARDLGFDGKTLIHPGTIAAANAAFCPTDEEVDFATRVVEAASRARESGEGMCIVDGLLIEELHVDHARRLIEVHAAAQRA